MARYLHIPPSEFYDMDDVEVAAWCKEAEAVMEMEEQRFRQYLPKPNSQSASDRILNGM